MSTDPKKNDEVKDAELDKVSGGAETTPPNEVPEYPKPEIRRPGSVQETEKT